MIVKSIELLGFKTFADRTRIDVGGGMTSLVGPNGCGKTNVCDALLWVLGESNVRNLRGQRVADVIFNGSDRRKALSLAEVSITLDNSTGILPLSYSEVTVTRRAYRNGETECFINKARCRLKDIQELFMDTGMGQTAYSVITQGEIDEVLSAKPEDRRELLEEAAGVKKYRARRQEALRKLEHTTANLQRVKDIMAELSAQLAPLEEQAQQAVKYIELAAQLKEIETGILIRELHRAAESLAQARLAKDEAEKRIVESRARADELEESTSDSRDRLARLEQDMDDARHAEQRIHAVVQRLTNRIDVAKERSAAAEAAGKREAEELENLDQRLAEVEVRLASLAAELASLQQSNQDSSGKSEEAQKRLAELESRYAEASRSASDHKANVLEMAKDLSVKRNNVANLRERAKQVDTQAQKITAQIAELGEQLKACQRREGSAHDAGVAVEDKIKAAATRLEELRVKRTADESERNKLQNRQGELSRELAGSSARLNTLKEMEDQHEGFFEGVRSVMSLHKDGKLAGEYAVVADVISVPKGYETAIEIALGANLQDIIAGSVEDAKRAIEFLKTQSAGRATFLPLDGMRPDPQSVRLGQGIKPLGLAVDLIQFDRRYMPAVSSLLGRTIITRDIDEAIAISRQAAGWNKIVTLDGEIIVPSGAIAGGAARRKGPGLLLRKQEIAELTQAVSDLGVEVMQTRSLLARTEEELSRNGTSIANTDREVAELRVKLVEHQKAVDVETREITRLARQIEASEFEKAELEAIFSQTTRSADTLEEELRHAGLENISLDEQVAASEQGLAELDRLRAEARDALMRVNVELAGANERSSSIGRAHAEATSQMNQLQAEKKSRSERVEGLAQEIGILQNEQAVIERELATQRTLFTAAQASAAKISEERTTAREEVAKADAKLASLTAIVAEATQTRHDAEVKEARLEMQVQQAAQRLFDEYEIGYDDAMAYDLGGLEIERGTAGEVARLRRDLKQMGPVNTGAVAEYERVKERWDFLTSQRADLEDASEQINTAISEIDASTHDMFMETFQTVCTHFDFMFKRMFGGGKTALSLTDPKNLLETGVDIAVQAPGKRMQELALLSGGERALTAAALMFALLMVRPSPFVILDEVDAPLDESNVEHFAEVVKEFSQQIQFLVITHNRATMEASENLYGVTMEEPGVSRVISVRLSTRPEDKEAEAISAAT